MDNAETGMIKGLCVDIYFVTYFKLDCIVFGAVEINEHLVCATSKE